MSIISSVIIILNAVQLTYSFMYLKFYGMSFRVLIMYLNFSNCL